MVKKVKMMRFCRYNPFLMDYSIYLLFIDHITNILQTAGYIVYNDMVQQKYIHYNNKLKDKYYLKRNILYSLN